MIKSIRIHGIGRRPLTAILGLVLLGTGCPAEEPDDEEASASGATSVTSGPTSSTTVDPSATSAGSETGSTSAVDTGMDSGSESAEETTTGGTGLCEIMLPPPEDCPAMATGSDRVVWLPYDRSLPGEPFEPAEQIVEPLDPQGGGMMGFIKEPDAPLGNECDVFQQDCANGEKCMPWASDGGGSWNATRCSPIAPMPDQLGDTCTVEGSGVSGIDSCDLAQMCWDVDPETNEGTCVEMCSCSEANPVCNTPNTICAISNDGVLALCLGVCNPLDPSACEAGEGCYPSGQYFQCAPDASGAGGAPGDPCEFINVCEPGTICTGAAGVPGCAGSGCCTSLCNPADGGGECLAGQDCVPWYDPGSEPDECLGQVGACVVPN